MCIRDRVGGVVGCSCVFLSTMIIVCNKKGPHALSAAIGQLKKSQRGFMLQDMSPGGMKKDGWEGREKGVRISSNPLVTVVPRDGIEPPTRGFSVPCSTD